MIQFLRIMNINEYPSKSEVTSPLETRDAEPLAEPIKRTWESLQLFIQSQTGLPADRLSFDHGEPQVQPQTKPTNIGMLLASLVAGERLGLMEPQQVNDHLSQIFDTLKKLERYNGFFYDWYDSRTGEKMTKWPGDDHDLNLFLSSVDNAWLAAGLLMVKKAKPEFVDLIDKEFLSQMDFEYFFDSEKQEVRGGYSVSKEKFTSFHYPRRLVSEPRVIYEVQATMVNDETKKQVFLKRLLDNNGNLPSDPAGGAIFELLMPRLFFREEILDPAIKRVFSTHQEYADKYMNGFTGVSVADDPTNQDQYSQMGVGGKYKASTVLTSHGMALSLLENPDKALQALRETQKIAGFYGKYGYNDAVDTATGKSTNTQVFVDQAMVFLSLFTYLDDSLLLDA